MISSRRGSASISVSTDDSEKLGTQRSKENHNHNMSMSQPMSQSMSYRKSPARSIGNKSNSTMSNKTNANTNKHNSNANRHKVKSIGGSVTSGNSHGHASIRSYHNHVGNANSTTATAITASVSASDMNIGPAEAINSNTNTTTPTSRNSNSNSNHKTPHSGLTINLAAVDNGHLIKMNPRDAASPRRNRTKPIKSKAYKEYETSMSIVDVPIDSLSLHSWKEGGTIGSNSHSHSHTSVSRASATSASLSVQSSSVGGLAFVETPHTHGAGLGSALDKKNDFKQKQPFSHKKSQPHTHSHSHSQHHPTNAANSVGSKSTTASKSSHRSKSSHSHATNRSKKSHNNTRNNNNTNKKRSSQSLEPKREEQILFEQRLCDEGHGVAVRKIHSNGKSQLRFVKCVSIPKDKLKNLNHADNNSYNNQNMSYSLPSLIGGGSGAQKSDVSSSRSVTSLMGRIAGRKHKSSLYGSAVGDHDHHDGSSPTSQFSKSIKSGGETTSFNERLNNPRGHDDNKMYTKALTWGNKKKVLIPLCKFVAVRKGKTTRRTKRNACHSSRLLSLVTNDLVYGSLDIETPTKLDREKFAKAFSVFLNVPLEDGLVGGSVVVKDESSSSGANRRGYGIASASGSSYSIADDVSSIQSMSSYNSTVATPQGQEYQIGGGAGLSLLPGLTPSPSSSKDEPKLFAYEAGALDAGTNLLPSSNNVDLLNHDGKKLNEYYDKNGMVKQSKPAQESNVFDMGSKLQSKGTPKRSRRNKEEGGEGDDDDNLSEVSSLTQGFDQEIVEELHQALTELRAELEASRAEAARAVKVAEQAIQSAESCSSNDWNSTVTHKAAEAAAQAQKRSAEAIAKQRQAEQKLAAEKKSASFWRNQAQSAEEDAGGLRTRLAVAEVERAGITEELEREKRTAASYIQTFKHDYAISESIQRETLARGAEQNKLLEIELDGTRRDLLSKANEVKMLQESIAELQNEMVNVAKEKGKMKFFGKSKKTRDSSNSRGRLLLEAHSSSANILENYNQKPSQNPSGAALTTPHSEQLLQIHAETTEMRKHYELLRRTTVDELKQLPEKANNWANAASKALAASQTEVTILKKKLSMEMANRRKLLGEVQDLRGSVRVYCRPRPISFQDGSSLSSIVSVPSHEVGLLHREKVLQNETNTPMSFNFDRMFTSNTSQRDIYAEMDELVLTSLDGYNSCCIAFGQNGCGKTHSLIGKFSFEQSQDTDVEPHVEITDCGIHLLAMQQIFIVSKQRCDRFQDSFTLSMVEIHDEKLIDLAAETDLAVSCGRLIIDNENEKNTHISEASGSRNDRKLEIRTDIDGQIIIQGLVAVQVQTYEDVEKLWKQCMARRVKRVQHLGKKLTSYDASTNLIVTLHVKSVNVATGVGTVGKVQFVDLAASDVVPRRGSLSSKSKTTSMDNILAPIGNTNEWKYANRSITQLADVVNARHQFSRSIPYRNSTLTHLLRDSLESDTKVLLLACVSSDPNDLQNTANSMRFAAKMKKVMIGKATKHTIPLA